MASLLRVFRKRWIGERHLDADGLTGVNRTGTNDFNQALSTISETTKRRSSFFTSRRQDDDEALRRFRTSVSTANDVVSLREEILSNLFPDRDDLNSMEARDTLEADILRLEDALMTAAWDFQESLCRRIDETEQNLKVLQTQRVKDITRYRDSIRATHQDISEIEGSVRNNKSFESLLELLDEPTAKLVRACVEEEMKQLIFDAQRNREGLLYELIRDKLGSIRESFEIHAKEAQKDSEEMRWQVKELRKQLNCSLHELAEARFNQKETHNLRVQVDSLRLKLFQARQETDEALKNLSRSEAVRLELASCASTAPIDFSQNLEELKNLEAKVDDKSQNSEETTQATVSHGTSPFAEVWRASLRSEASTGHVSEGFCSSTVLYAESLDMQQSQMAVQPVGDDAHPNGDLDGLRADSGSETSGRQLEKQEYDDITLQRPSGVSSAAHLLAHARSLNDLLEDEPKKGRDLLGTLEHVGEQLDKEILDEALAICPSQLVGSLAISLLIMRVQGARRECLALRSLCCALLDVIAHWYASLETLPNIVRTSRISQVLKMSRGRLTQCFLTVWQGWSEMTETRKRARDLQRQQKASSHSGEENAPTRSWIEPQPSGAAKAQMGGATGIREAPEAHVTGWGLDENNGQSAEAPSTVVKPPDHWSCDRPSVSSVVKSSPRESRGSHKGRPKSGTKHGGVSSRITGDSPQESNTPVFAFEEELPSNSSSGLETSVTKLPAIEGRSSIGTRKSRG